MYNNMTEDKEDYDIEKWSQFLAKVVGNNPNWLQICSTIILVTIFIVGLFGNLLTCTVIYYDKKMHTATNYYLFNMAVSDTIVSFGIFLEINVFLTDSYLFGRIACKIHFFFIVVLWNNSILVMTTLAIERYLAIWYPLFLKSVPSRKRVIKVLTAIWIIAICETVPELFTVELVKRDKVAYCFTAPSSLARIVNGILALVTFIIPLVIMLFVYTMIAFKVNISEKLCTDRKIFNHKDNRRKVNKLVVVMTLSFMICWLPFFSFRLLFFLCNIRELMELEQFWSIGYKVSMINCWFSIVLNPILFSLISTKFRKSLKDLWKTKIKREDHSIITAL